MIYTFYSIKSTTIQMLWTTNCICILYCITTTSITALCRSNTWYPT